MSYDSSDFEHQLTKIYEDEYSIHYHPDPDAKVWTDDKYGTWGCEMEDLDFNLNVLIEQLQHLYYSWDDKHDDRVVIHLPSGHYHVKTPTQLYWLISGLVLMWDIIDHRLPHGFPPHPYSNES